MSPLVVFLLLGMTAPQNQAGPAQAGDVRAQAEQKFVLQGLDHLRIQVQQRNLPDSRRTLQRTLFGGANLCFAIRSYVFARQDGNAPVLVSTSTCTPASTILRRQVANPPEAKLVPQ